MLTVLAKLILKLNHVFSKINNSFIHVKIIGSSFRNNKFHFQEKMCQNYSKNKKKDFLNFRIPENPVLSTRYYMKEKKYFVSVVPGT